MSIYDAIANPMVPNIAQATMQGRGLRMQEQQAGRASEAHELQMRLGEQQVQQNQTVLDEQDAESYARELDRAYRTASSAANLYNRILPNITDEESYQSNLETLRMIDRDAPDNYDPEYLGRRGATSRQWLQYEGELGQAMNNLAQARRTGDTTAANLFATQIQALSTPTPEGSWRMNEVFEGTDGRPVISMSNRDGAMLLYNPDEQQWESMGPFQAGAAPPANGQPTRPAVQQLQTQINSGQVPTMTREQFAALPEKAQEQAAVNDLMQASEELMEPEDREYIDNLRGRSAADGVAAEERARLEVRQDFERQENIEEARIATNQAMVFARTQIETLDRLLYSEEGRGSRINFYTTGLIGSILGNIPGFDPYDVQQQLASVRSAKGFQQLMEIKRTGAGLGHVPQVQLESLQNSIISLSERQSAEQLEENIRRYREELRTLMEVSADRFRTTYEEEWDAYRDEERPARRRYNPEQRRLER